MTAGPRTVEPGRAQEYAARILAAAGASEGSARRVAESLVSANLAGHDSHGVQLVPYYVDLMASGRIDADARPESVLDLGALVVIDGRLGFGQVVGMDAVRLAVERAREHGIGCVVGRNANHLGRLGEYTTRMADDGFAAVLLVNFQGGDQHLAPWGGLDPRLTNNPISLAAPAAADAAVVDMALSVVAESKVWLARSRGERLPQGWVVDRNGQPTTDPDALANGGVLTPVGGETAGHKAYALVALVDVLAGLLSGGGACREGSPPFSNAFVLVAFDVGRITDRVAYDEGVESLRRWVKSSRKRPGVQEILFPGEHEARTARSRRTEGIQIEKATLQALAELARDHGVEAL